MEEEIKKIWNAELKERVELIHNSSCKEVRIDITSSLKDTPYSWVAYRKREYAGGSVFPMRNANEVAFFKTIKGAKRNFLKQYYPKELVAKITLLSQSAKAESLISADIMFNRQNLKCANHITQEK